MAPELDLATLSTVGPPLHAHEREQDPERSKRRRRTANGRTRNLNDLIANTKMITNPIESLVSSPWGRARHVVGGYLACALAVALLVGSISSTCASETRRAARHHHLFDNQRDLRSNSNRWARSQVAAQPASYHQLTSQDLASADQLDDPAYALDSGDDQFAGMSPRPIEVAASSGLTGETDDGFPSDSLGEAFSEFGGHLQGAGRGRRRRGNTQSSSTSAFGGGSPSTTGGEQMSSLSNNNNNNNNEEFPDEKMENSQENPDRNLFVNDHNSHLRAMRDMFERRHVVGGNGVGGGHHHKHHHRSVGPAAGNPLQPNSQELSPISIGLDPPFAMPPFQMGGDSGVAPPPPMPKPPSMGSDAVDSSGPSLPFGLNPLPHLLGFQSSAFDGPQRGDQSAHSNHHAAAAPNPDTEMPAGGGGPSQKVWPKIFRFTDGRINLSDFEKQKKIRLSNKNQHAGGENHIESAPIMFDGRQLKRKSFLILHGGVFPGN